MLNFRSMIHFINSYDCHFYFMKAEGIWCNLNVVFELRCVISNQL